MKTCFKCGEHKPLTDFYKHSGMADGRLNKCKKCTIGDVARNRKRDPLCRQKEWLRSEAFKNRKYWSKHPHERWTDEDRRNSRLASATKYASKRRARIANRTPSWANSEEIGRVFLLASERGLSVDHIVPLFGKKVCGLHVQDNLRCIPKRLNEIKTSCYWPDMWDETKAKSILEKHTS